MIIDCLKLHNFRLFEDVELQLNSRTCVLVGINGAGKSTLLDAMCILLSCYVGGFDGLGVRRIAQSDIRHVTHKSGSFYENVSQLPVEISAVGTLGGSSLVWKSAKLKDSPQSSSPSAYAEMTQLAKEHQLRLREGDDTLALPLIAYYGTGRLWKRETSKQRRERRLQATFRRLSVYEDCLDAHLTDTTLATWFERMTIKYLQRGGDMPEFTAVRKALSNGLQTLTGFSKVEFQSNFDTHELEVIYEDGDRVERIPSSQLSDGYRVALNLFADIAYRAAQLNPQLGDSVLAETEGIVLIDEIDLHLHPQWQQLVLSDLAITFPRIQFVVTTHSSSVIASAEGCQLVVVDGNKVHTSTRSFYGRDSNSILRELMEVSERPKAVMERFRSFYALVDAGEYERAELALSELRNLLGDTDAELTACEVQLDLERFGLS